MSTKSGSLSIVCVQMGPRKVSSSRVSTIQGLLKYSLEPRPPGGGSRYETSLSIEVNGRTVGTFRIVRYIVVVRC